MYVACFDWYDNILVPIITNHGTFTCLVSDYKGFQNLGIANEVLF